MAGFPDRDKAWAKRQVEEQGGRPHRMTVMCLLVDKPGDAWRGMSHDQQRAALQPFVLEDECVRFSNEGEAYIQPLGRGQGEGSALTVDEARAAARAAAHWAGVAGKLKRSAYQEAYAAATAHLAGKYVMLEEAVLEKALASDASPAERRMALAMAKDWKDRHMGKPVAPTEDVSAGGGSEVSEWIAAEAPAVLPLSAGWTVESVAEEQRRMLEAGEIVGDA